MGRGDVGEPLVRARARMPGGRALTFEFEYRGPLRVVALVS